MGQHTYFYSDRSRLERKETIDTFLDDLDESIEILTMVINVLKQNAKSVLNDTIIDGLWGVLGRLTEIKDKNEENDGEVLEYHDIFKTNKNHEDGTYIDDVHLLSLDETLEFINEGHCGFNVKGRWVYLPSGCEEGQLVLGKLKEFWENHPNGYITFC